MNDHNRSLRKTPFLPFFSRAIVFAFVFIPFAAVSADAQEAARWSESRVSKWYDDQPWLVGCNYLPSTAINQLEMWTDFDELCQ